MATDNDVFKVTFLDRKENKRSFVVIADDEAEAKEYLLAGRKISGKTKLRFEKRLVTPEEIEKIELDHHLLYVEVGNDY